MMEGKSPDVRSRPRFRPRSLELFNGTYRAADLGRDVMAGLTVGMIALPLALALGIAGVPHGVDTPFPAPALGIFTAIIAGLIISALGGSRVQIGGPTAAFIPIVLLIIEASNPIVTFATTAGISGSSGKLSRDIPAIRVFERPHRRLAQWFSAIFTWTTASGKSRT